MTVLLTAPATPPATKLYKNRTKFFVTFLDDVDDDVVNVVVDDVVREVGTTISLSFFDQVRSSTRSGRFFTLLYFASEVRLELVIVLVIIFELSFG